jgi:hypothetical protein
MELSIIQDALRIKIVGWLSRVSLRLLHSHNETNKRKFVQAIPQSHHRLSILRKDYASTRELESAGYLLMAIRGCYADLIGHRY